MLQCDAPGETARLRESIGGMIRVKETSPAKVAFILLDSSLKPLCCNSEALRILAYPNPPPKALGDQFLESIRSIVGKKSDTNGFPMTTHDLHCRLETRPVRNPFRHRRGWAGRGLQSPRYA